MKFFVYGSDRLYDAPDWILLIMKDGRKMRLAVDENSGIVVAPGAGVTRLSLFKAPGEGDDALWRYRTTEVVPWENILSIEMNYPDPEQVDKAVWVKVDGQESGGERIAPEETKKPEGGTKH